MPSLRPGEPSFVPPSQRDEHRPSALERSTPPLRTGGTLVVHLSPRSPRRLSRRDGSRPAAPEGREPPVGPRREGPIPPSRRDARRPSRPERRAASLRLEGSEGGPSSPPSRGAARRHPIPEGIRKDAPADPPGGSGPVPPSRRRARRPSAPECRELSIVLERGATSPRAIEPRPRPSIEKTFHATEIERFEFKDLEGIERPPLPLAPDGNF